MSYNTYNEAGYIQTFCRSWIRTRGFSQINQSRLIDKPIAGANCETQKNKGRGICMYYT